MRKMMFATAVMLPMTSVAMGDVIAWDAGSNALPDSEGWDLVLSTGLPTPSISGGQMSMGPSSYGGQTYFNYDFAMSPAAPGETISLEVEAMVSAATYGNQSGFLRGGFEMYLANDAGQWAIIEMGESQISLRNQNSGVNVSPFFNIDTGSFHTYKLELTATNANVYIDSDLVLSSALGTGNAPNSAFFGDGTILGSSTASVKNATLAIPAPGASVAMCIAGLGASRRRR